MAECGGIWRDNLAKCGEILDRGQYEYLFIFSRPFSGIDERIFRFVWLDTCLEGGLTLVRGVFDVLHCTERLQLFYALLVRRYRSECLLFSYEENTR